MADLLSLLLTNPHGIDNSPLKYGQSVGEIRNADDPYYGTGGPSMPASLAYLLSGIPMGIEGAQKARQGSLEGDPIKAAGGIGQAALAALPAAGKAAAPIYETLPGLAGLLTAGTVAPMAAEGAFSSTPAEAGEQTSPLQGLYADRSRLSDQLQNATRARDAEGRTGKGPKYQAADAEVSRLTSQIGGIEGMIRDENEKTSPEAIARQKQADFEQQKANERAELDKPFAERHPYINTAMAVGGPTLAGALSFAGMRGVANKGNKLLQDLQDARQAGDTIGMQEAAARLSSWENPLTRYSKQTAAFALPATLPMDMRLMGDTIDKYTLPPDSKAQQAAKERLADIPQYLKDSEQALMSGLVMSATGGKTGAMTAGGAPGSDARAMLSLYGDKDPATLSKLLQDGADATASVQGPLGRAQKARQARESGNQQLDSADAQVAGAARELTPSSEPPHHSALQPRKNGRFSGPPLRPENDK